MTTDEPVFSDRTARDEDARADALAQFQRDGATIAALEADSDADRQARFCFIIEAAFTEYERRHREQPDALTPVAGYRAQTPGTYGAEITPVFLQVMHELMARYGAPVFLVH